MGTQAKCHNSSLFEHQWLSGNDGKGKSAGNHVFFGYVWPQVNVPSIRIWERKGRRVPRLDQVESRWRKLLSHLDAENGSLANWPGMYLQRWICANLTNQQELARCVILYSFSLRLHKTNLGMLRGKSLKQLDILSYHLFEYVILYSHVFPGFIAGSTYQFLTLWPEHQKIYSACPAPRLRSMLWLLSGLLHCSTCIFMIMVFRCFQYLFYTFHYFPHLSLCDWGSSWVIRCHPYSTHKTNATLLRKFRRVPIAVHSLLSGLAHATYEEHTNQ